MIVELRMLERVKPLNDTEKWQDRPHTLSMVDSHLMVLKKDFFSNMQAGIFYNVQGERHFSLLEL